MKLLFFCALFSLSVLWISCQRSGADDAVKPPFRPNILYIMADDLGYGDLSCYGQQRFTTPRLDQMAEEGMRFTQHYAGSTVCAPSRSVLMTGLHTGHTYIRGNREIEPEGQYPLPDSAITVGDLLQQAGYTTGIIGKWGLGYPGSSGVPEKQGFDMFFGYNCQRQAHHYYPEQLWQGADKITLEENANGKKGAYSHNLFTQEAKAFIRENASKDNPFFLYLAYTLPHADMDVPDSAMTVFQGKFEEEPFAGNHYVAQPTPRAAFAGMVTLMDQSIGQLLDLLKELDIDENTLVIFTSDNGPHSAGGHTPDFFDSNGPLKGYKRDLYEGGIRVPMIARWPGKIKAGSSSAHASAFWDFMPTACELAGVQPPAYTDGLSYAPTLLGQEQAEHDYLYWEFHEQGKKQAVRKGKWKAVRTGVAENPKASLELYDLSADQGETNDVAAQQPEVVQEMEQIMQKAHREDPAWLFFAQAPNISSGEK